jgi:hypothetical protein
MKKKEKKQRHKATYIFAILLLAASAAALVFWMVRPRPAHLGMAVVLAFCGWRVHCLSPLEVYERNPKKADKSVRGYMLGLVPLLWMVLVFLSPLELAFPSHMPWEYAWEVKDMKEDAPQRYYYFPDEIPEGAKNIVWKQYPGYLQGKAFKYLMFTADEAYIQSELEKYKEDVVLVKAQEVSVYPLHREVAPERRDKVEIYMLYQASNPEEYPSAMGYMVDREQGMICYFYE